MSLLTELKRRNVFRVGIAYAVGAWLLLQLTEVLSELLNLPEEIGPIVVTLVVLGLPVALFFAWAFEMTPEGIKRESEVDRTQSITHNTGRKLDFAIIALLAVGLFYFIYESRFMAREGSPVTTTDTAEVSAAKPDTESKEAVAESAAIDPRSIAVLPFANRSFNEEDSFFTDGIHDDLLTQLAKISDLKVVSRTSVMQYKETEKPIPQIAEELRVGRILEGGVQRAGNRVRINAQLIDVSNDQHLWAETFDREMTVENLFDIQSEITRHIVQAVRGELTDAERANLARVPTNNLEAYEAYLQALALTNRTDYAQQNFIEAQFWAERAVTLDPKFAQAWAMLVEINGQAVWMGYDDTPERMEAARQALEMAQRHGPELAETIAAEAEYAYRIESDFKRASELYAKAHQALPGDVDILFRLGVAQRRTPDLDGAIDSFRRAMVLDPQHSRSPTVLAEMLVSMNRLDEAADFVDQAILQFPDSRDLRITRIQIMRGKGNLEMTSALFDNMTPWVSPAYFQEAWDLPFQTRDFEKVLEVWELPQMQALTDNRGLYGLEHYSKATALDLLGQPEAAQSEARACIRKISDAPPVASYNMAFELMTLGLCYALEGDSEQAIRAANEATTMLPEDKDMLFGSFLSQGRAQVLAMAGEREEALAEIERLLASPYSFNRWRLYQDAKWDFFRDDERFNDLIRPEGVEGP